ncbi:MAG: hypothetical protein MI923_04090 [Phycisphaerales bacterium]|nr:hypothetical protein [Phycisphaerales bacterium]
MSPMDRGDSYSTIPCELTAPSNEMQRIGLCGPRSVPVHVILHGVS